MLQYSKVLKSREEWKQKACERANQQREDRKTKKRHQVQIADLKNQVTLLEEDLSMTEKKAKLVKPSWYENKWLYFGYGSVLTYAVLALVEQAGHAINIF